MKYESDSRLEMRSMTGTFLILALLAIMGCEQALDPDNPYVERLVVNGVVTAGDTTILVMITRTLPLDRPAESSDGWISDASAAIIAGEGASAVRIPLVYLRGGTYAPAERISVVPGRYRLEAEWHGLRVSAETTVPEPVPIDSVRIVKRENPYGRGDTSETFEAIFRPQGENVYHLSYRLKEFLSGSVSMIGRGAIARRGDTLPSGDIRLLFDAYMELPNDYIEAVLHTFDPLYYDFYQTYRLHDEGDGPFSTGADLTRWNVQGDGIGLFIGHAVATRNIE